MEDNTTAHTTRRRVLKTGAAGLVAGAIGGIGTVGAAKGKPDFSPRIWAFDEAYGTKVTGEIKHPNPRSLDKFFIITNGVDGKLPDGTAPVSDAAPGHPGYNGGRWWTHVVEWNQAGIDAHGSPPPLLTQYSGSTPNSIELHEGLGHLTITEGSPGGMDAPPDYFRCPLLPVK